MSNHFRMNCEELNRLCGKPGTVDGIGKNDNEQKRGHRCHQNQRLLQLPLHFTSGLSR